MTKEIKLVRHLYFLREDAKLLIIIIIHIMNETCTIQMQIYLTRNVSKLSLYNFAYRVNLMIGVYIPISILIGRYMYRYIRTCGTCC